MCCIWLAINCISASYLGYACQSFKTLGEYSLRIITKLITYLAIFFEAPSITVILLLTSMETILPLSAEEIAQVKGWMEKDRAYEGLLGGMQRRMGEEAREVFGVDGIAGSQWWERGAHGNGMSNWNRWRKAREPFELRYPRQRPHVSRSGRKTMKREGLRLFVFYFLVLSSRPQVIDFFCFLFYAVLEGLAPRKQTALNSLSLFVLNLM